MRLITMSILSAFMAAFNYGPFQAPVAPQVRVDTSPLKAKASSIVAAQFSGGKSQWTGSGRGDDLNREYSEALPVVIQRAQDLDVNNPDVKGFHRSRTAQVIGRGLRISSSIRGPEIGIDEQDAADLNDALNSLRENHSRMGGFDAKGHRRSEGKLQEIAYRTTLVHGSALIHRVWKPEVGRLHPLAIEIVPVTRLETPPWEMGSKTISQGIKYSDDRRSEVLGFWIRKPARTIGNSYIKTLGFEDFDFVGVDHMALMMLTEIAGQDRSLPAITCCVRSLRNKGEFLEASLETARAQAKREGFITVEEGGNSWDRAEDDSEQAGTASDAEPIPVNSVTQAGTYLTYLNAKETYTPADVKLPTPNLKDYIDIQTGRQAVGVSMSNSRFTRIVQTSYSGGRQEEQHDEPIIDQERELFECPWQAVNEWFIAGVYLDSENNKIMLPGYSEKTKPYFYRTEVLPMSAKLAINPVDQVNADKGELALRAKTPQQLCAERGRSFKQNLDEWARAVKAIRAKEVEMDLPQGTLDILLNVSKTDTTSSNPRDGDGDGIINEGKQGNGIRGQDEQAL